MPDAPHSQALGTDRHAGTESAGLDRAGIVAAGILLVLYVMTLCPTTYSGDAPELAAAAHTFGIPHPPGYALYTLCANAWTRILPFGDAGWLVNLLSAFAGALACWFVSATVRRLGGSSTGGVVAAVSLGVGQTFWSQATISEVYAFDAMLGAAALYFALRAQQTKRTGATFLAVLVLTAWVHHRASNLAYAIGPVLLMASQLRPGRRTFALLPAVLLPCLTWLYLPIAASADPLINSGDPRTFDRFYDLVTASAYRHYLFGGDFLPQLWRVLTGLPRDLGLMMLLAPLGALALWARAGGRRATIAIGAVALGNLAFTSNYAVPDIASFTIPLAVCAAILAGCAIPITGQDRATGSLLGPAALVAAVVLGTTNYRTNDLSGQTLCRDFAASALGFVAPRSIVLSHVDSVTFSLWYGQAVLDVPSDVLVVSRGRTEGFDQRHAKRRRPDLNIAEYTGRDAPSAWPALLALQNAEDVPIYVTADVRGYFRNPYRQRVLQTLRPLPAGLLTELRPKNRPAPPTEIIRKNAEFWQRAWPDATAARAQRLHTDMAGLVLHYASMRMIFARYCLKNGDSDAAERGAQAVLDLDPKPLIEPLAALLASLGRRYHMTDMVPRAEQIVRQARDLRSGKLTLAQLRNQPEPHQIPDLFRRAVEHTLRMELPKARQILESILLVRPSSPETLYQLALVLDKQGDRSGAIKQLETLLADAPRAHPVAARARTLLEALRK